MTTSSPLLMRCSTAELRAKLIGGQGQRLGMEPLWHHFLTLAREDDWFTPYTVLAALVTREDEDRERARAAFLRFVDLAPQGLTSTEAQFHTHVTSAQLGRWAIFYDWLADEALFSDEEDESIRSALLDHAFVFPHQGLKGRVRSFDNQVLANAFGAAAVGYVLGVKRGQSALGRRLFHSGMGWLHELFKLLPAGGYSGEGSTYQEHVVLPLVLLSALLVEETTGLDVMRVGVTPGGPALELLQFTHRLIGPAGLMPAWDDHGFQLATVKAPLVYLARLTGDQAPLETLLATNMWSRTALPAWETDDRLWALVWWPAGHWKSGSITADHMAGHFRPWMAPPFAAALQHPDTQTRLFQCWDICGGLLHAGRLQTDPNAITLEAHGSPLLVDGNGQLPPGTVAYPPTARDYVGDRMLQTIKEYRGWEMPEDEAVRMALSGSIATSNALVFDEEDWFVPRNSCSGQGLALHYAGAVQAVTSEASAYYQARYRTQSVRRTSLLLPGGAVFVCDQVHAEAPHHLKWQAYLREGVQQAGDRAVLETPELVRCEVIPLQEGQLQLTPMEGYPRYAVGRSVRLEFRPQNMEDLCHQRLDFALVPQPLWELALDLSEGWAFNFGRENHSVSMPTAYLQDSGCQPQQARVFARRFSFEPGGNRVYLKVQAASTALQVMVNGQLAVPTHPQQKGIWPQSQTFLPHWFEVTELVRSGTNEVELKCPWFHGESVVGPVQLLRRRPAQEVSVERTGPDTFTLKTGPQTQEVLLERKGLGAWLDGTTDARQGLLDEQGILTLFHVSQLDFGARLRVSCQPAADLVLAPGETQLLGPQMGTRLSVERPEGTLRVELGGCLEISYIGDQPHVLRVNWPWSGPILVNGEAVEPGLPDSDGNLQIPLAPQTLEAEPLLPTDVEGLYALAARWGASPPTEAAILEALAGSDWRLVTVAAELAGRLGLTGTVPLLLQIFEAEDAEWPYPELTQRWAWSKMLNQAETVGFDPNLPAVATKRWRVRRATVTALGLLQDTRAVAPLEAALLRCHDFFPVTSQLAVALGRLGAQSSLLVLERHLNHAEVNTAVHSGLAHQLLSGLITRAEFEGRVGLL